MSLPYRGSFHILPRLPGFKAVKRILLLLCIVSATAYADDQPRKIGLLAELTGQFARNGRDCRIGYQIAYDEAGAGKNVLPVYGDTQGVASAGVVEAQRIINQEKALVVITPRSPVGMAVNPISLESRVPLFGILGHPGFVANNKYAFRVYPSASQEGRALAEKAIQLGKRRAFSLTAEDEYLLSISEAFRSRYTELGGQVAAAETVLAGEQDFSAAMAKVERSPAECVLINLGPGQYASAYKKMAERHLSRQIFANFMAGLPDVMKAAGAAADGTIFVEMNVDKPDFQSKFSARTQGERSGPIGYACYIALAAVLDVIRSHPEAGDRDSLYAALLDEKKVQLPDGEVEFKDREAVVDLQLEMIKEGRVERFAK